MSDTDRLRNRARALQLHGLLAHWDEVAGALPRDNQGENRIASSRNAPEAKVHCLIQNAPDESVVGPF